MYTTTPTYNFMFQGRTCGVVLLFLLNALAFGDEPEKAKPNQPLPFQIQHCPCKGALGDQAAIDLPKGYIFIDQANAPKFLEYNQNIPDGDEVGVVLPENGDWFVIYSFQDVGYVKDEEKSKLDADALLKTFKEATEAANEERRRRGWGTMTVIGWHEKPHYDETSHNLEWSIIGQNEQGGRSVNHNSRYLGRRGVMSANLVTSPADITTNLASFRTLSNGFGYKAESRYSAFVKGDKVAEYGLTALILGGAAAAAAKTGLLKSALKLLAAFWKLILLGIAGLGGAIAKLFKRRKKEPEQELETT